MGWSYSLFLLAYFTKTYIHNIRTIIQPNINNEIKIEYKQTDGRVEKTKHVIMQTFEL